MTSAARSEFGLLAAGVGGASFGAFRAFTPPQITEVPVKLVTCRYACAPEAVCSVHVHVGATL